jgi:hypothetical protein
MIKKSSFVLVVLLTLSGCGTPLIVKTDGPRPGEEDKRTVVAADLASRPPVSDFGGATLPWSEAGKKFTISRRDPVYAFDEGRAYFKVVSLPGSASRLKLKLLSYYSLDFPTTLFVPALIFLDSSRQVVAKNLAPEYTIVNGLPEHIRVLAEVPEGAAYVVIYTTPARVAEQMDFQTYRMTGVLPSPSFDSKKTGFGGFYEGILKLAHTKE